MALAKEHRNKPDSQQLSIFFFSCHGIDRSSNQHIVLNEFDKSTQFYKLLGAEAKIRVLSEELKNGYFIALFACCRELYSVNRHGRCIGARSVEEARNEF